METLLLLEYPRRMKMAMHSNCNRVVRVYEELDTYIVALTCERGGEDNKHLKTRC